MSYFFFFIHIHAYSPVISSFVFGRIRDLNTAHVQLKWKVSWDFFFCFDKSYGMLWGKNMYLLLKMHTGWQLCVISSNQCRFVCSVCTDRSCNVNKILLCYHSIKGVRFCISCGRNAYKPKCRNGWHRSLHTFERHDTYTHAATTLTLLKTFGFDLFMV